MSGGGNKQTTTQQGTMPSWVQPYYQSDLSNAAALNASGGPAYQQNVAPMTDLQNQGIQSIAGAAGGPNATQGAIGANNFMTSGALLDPNANPYLQAQFHTGANQIQNQIASQFAGSGSNVQNSIPVQQQGMADYAAQLYGNAYGQGLGAMNQASAMAPSLDAGSYIPGQSLLGAGTVQQQQAQNVQNATDVMANYQSQLPYNMQSWYTSLLNQGASPFQGQTSVQQQQGNPWMGALGGAMSGASAGSSLGPWGAVGGGLLGGATGYMTSK